ncbi:MAG: Stp1/IreP family PP2C-type Ser/Thr phosphatase [Ruminococcaceae bacterium]|nr:Stp1/IreP family PP2C-type Ser/Thr phosphatase [Oscillospiraceae bacterium]
MIAFAAKTDIGKVRKINQDYYLASADKPYLFILCDGMGGHKSGEVASRAAAESIETYIRMHSTLDLDDTKAERVLKGAVSYANNIVSTRASSHEDYTGMGTTTDVCMLDFDMLYIAHVGDSRVYLLREGKLSQLTTDHSYVEELVQSGLITEKEAMSHPDKNVITRAVGTNRTVECDFISTEIHQDDILLMCSDGLSNMLTESEIKNMLISDENPEQVVDNLIRCANDNGGRDNITAIVIKKLLKEEA